MGAFWMYLFHFRESLWNTYGELGYNGVRRGEMNYAGIELYGMRLRMWFN